MDKSLRLDAAYTPRYGTHPVTLAMDHADGFHRVAISPSGHCIDLNQGQFWHRPCWLCVRYGGAQRPVSEIRIIDKDAARTLEAGRGLHIKL